MIYTKPTLNYKDTSKENKSYVTKTFQSDKSNKKKSYFSEESTPRQINKTPRTKNIKKDDDSNLKIIEKPKTPTKRSFIKTYENNIKEDRSLTNSQVNISQISEDKTHNRSKSYSNTSIITIDKIDYSRLYNKREKAELNLSRGMTKDLKKLFDQFLRPTLLIVDVDRGYIQKFNPSIEFFKNSIMGYNINKNKIEDISLNISNSSKLERSKFLNYKD
jgi:hypothetical protein